MSLSLVRDAERAGKLRGLPRVADRWVDRSAAPSRALLDGERGLMSACRQRPLVVRRTDERRSAGVQVRGGSRVPRSTTVVSATSSVTLPTVRKMSGIISTATSKPSGAIGHAQRHRDRRDRADEADLARQADGAVAHHRADGGRGDHLAERRMKPEPVGDVEGDRDVHRRARRPEQRDRDRQASRRRPARECPSSRAAVSIAGSEASDERVEIATACGAIIAAAESAEPDPRRRSSPADMPPA